MFAYNLNTGSVYILYSNPDITDICNINGNRFCIKEGKLYRISDTLVIEDKAQIESGFIDLQGKFRTVDVIVDRVPLEEVTLYVTNEGGETVSYTLPKNAIKTDLARGHKLRYLKYRIDFDKQLQINKIIFLLEKEVTI